ncbi:NME NM23 member 5 [Phytophthora boehmeriae]|uniref:NME NM23 member 5 n=1 Tax=Phytophthora boehmeriae TaxID=109152 RepID=A0A8T1X453_9STRA|nr:NME NM23 member 5 [Phytophthora boehmeriae]
MVDDDSFVVVILKPEIATGNFKFASTGSTNKSAAESSSIPGVSAVEASFLLPNGHIIPHVLTKITEEGFEIVQQRMKQFTRVEARQLFLHELQRLENDEQAYSSFIVSMSRGPSQVLLLRLSPTIAKGDVNAAINKWNGIAGAWDPAIARKKALAGSVPHDQWPLRALCGLDAIQSGITNSAHLSCARRERFFLFPPATPRLERATIVLLATFHSNFPNGKEYLLTKLEKEARAVVVATMENCTLSADEVVMLCSLTRIPGEGPMQEACVNVVRHADQVVGDKGVDVLVIEGLDLSYSLRAVVGPTNLELARLYFPESVRAQMSSKQPSVELPAGLYSDKTADHDALGFESGLFMSFDARLNIGNPTDGARLAGAPPKGTQVERTFGIIKPNAAHKPEVVKEIINLVSLFGFTVEHQRRLRLTRDQAGEFYAEHRGKVFFETLLSFMTSGEIVALQLSRPHAIRVWRALMGPTNSSKARETHPWTLRARFGEDGTRNATHGSDSSVSAARELRYFFGSASIAGDLSNSSTLNARIVAQRSIAIPGASPSSVEKILAQGLQELMEIKVSDPLEACRWLGTWLVNYRSHGLDEDQQLVREPQQPTRALKLDRSVNKPSSSVPGTDQEARKVVAIVFGSAVDNNLRSSILGIIQRRLEEARYKIIDVSAEIKRHPDPSTGVSSLVKDLKACGRRRCVLFDCEELTQRSMFHREFKAQSPTEWHINFVVRMDLDNTQENTFTSSSPFDVPVVHVNLPGSNLQKLEAENILHGCFCTVFDASVVLLDDPQQLVPISLWTEAAKRFGFHLLTFEALIASVKSSSNESDEARLLLQLLRSGSNVPSKLILPLLRRSILGSQPGSNGVHQKFLLMGFPWSKMQSSELEKEIGEPQSVLFVNSRGEQLRFKTTAIDFPAWMNAFRKKGLVKRIGIDSVQPLDPDTVSKTLNGVLAPVIGCFLGECGDQQQLQELQAVAKAQGFVWIDCTSPNAPTVHKLRQVLLSTHAGLEKYFLYCYPHTPAQAVDFLYNVAVPQFVLHSGYSSSQDVLKVFDAHQAIVQADISIPQASDAALSRLKSIFFRKQVVAVVGNVGILNLPQLRNVVAPLGYDVIDVQIGADSVDMEYEQLLAFERRIQATQAPRCLVIGAPESSNFYHALESRIGCAMHKILILQHVPVRAPNPDALDDEDFGDSDEEEGQSYTDENDSDGDTEPLPGVKLGKVMKALSPQLSQLLQTFATSATSSILIDIIGFLESTPRGSAFIIEGIVAHLRPRLVCVVGHPFSFYQTIARSCCRCHITGFIDTRQAMSSLEAIEKIESIVAATPHASYCLDGFPRALLPGDTKPSGPASPSPLRYVAQQLWELNRRVGSLSTLVRFTATVKSLEERTPEKITRRILDEAQDELELGSSDLLDWFATGKSRHGATSEVSCDQTLEDAQEEFDSVLQQVLRPRRLVVKQKAT